MRLPAVAVDWNPQHVWFKRPQRVEVRVGEGAADLVGKSAVDVPFAVSALVRRLEVIVPVRRRCRIRLRVVDGAGSPVEGAGVSAVTWGGLASLSRTPAPYFEPSKSGADGVIEVDVPYFVRDSVSVRVIKGSWAEEHWTGASGPIPLRPGVVNGSNVEVSRTEPSEGPAVGAGWGRGGEPERKAPRRPGVLVVRALDSAGHPLPRAALVVDDGQKHFALADSEGMAKFTELESGRVTLAFADRALRPRSASVDTHVPGAGVVYEFTEPEGRSLDVLVVHDDGTPAAFADVVCTVGQREYWPVIDGAWRSRLTDADGRLRIPGAPRDPVELTVTYGSRRVIVGVPPDQIGTVRVRLPGALR